MSEILKVNKIKKNYNKKCILKDISFSVNEGEILAFIGPNGAGKTTTLKLILGLESIDSGEIYINGYNIKKNYKKSIERVGAIVEEPDLYSYLTGRKNLELIANMYNNIPDGRIEDVVEKVGLNNRIDDKVSKYSLGMKQRLGIAAALIQGPNLLLLDEPTNGLDPEGIKEIRDLIKRLAKKEKIAVVISSHNLSELEGICTNVCIIKNGEIINYSSMKEIRKNGRENYIITLDKTKSIKKLFNKDVDILDENTIRLYKEKEEIPEVINKLIESNYKIYEIVNDKISLEEAFLKNTGGNEIE